MSGTGEISSTVSPIERGSLTPSFLPPSFLQPSPTAIPERSLSPLTIPQPNIDQQPAFHHEQRLTSASYSPQSPTSVDGASANVDITQTLSFEEQTSTPLTYLSPRPRSTLDTVPSLTSSSGHESLSESLISPILPQYPHPIHDKTPSTLVFQVQDENRPQTPLSPLSIPPGYSKTLSRNVSTSDFASYDGSTACPTPTAETTLLNNASPYAFNNYFPSTNTFDIPIDKKLYTVETIHESDDVDLLVPWKRRLYRLSPLFTLLAVITYFGYYGFRIWCTIQAEKAFHKGYIMAWFFIAAEGCVACAYIHVPLSIYFLMIYRPSAFPPRLPNALHSRPQTPQAPSYR